MMAPPRPAYLNPPDAPALVDISVVIPVYREAEFLEELTQRLIAVLDEVGSSYEIIFTDDGSKDGSLDILQRLLTEYACVHVVKLTRNFGQIPATIAAIRVSRGEIIITMDADLQNPPEDIPLFLAKLDEGYEVVHGVRGERHVGIVRKIGSAYIQWLLSRTGVDLTPDVTSFRAFTRRVAEMALEYKESTRFLAPVIAWTGASACSVPVRHTRRVGSRSGYSLWQLASITVELLVSISYLPLRVSAIAGSVLSTLSLFVGLTAIVLWATGRIGVPGFTSLIVAITFLSGVQLIFLGILGEYLARMYMAEKERPPYHIDWVDKGRAGDLP